MKIVTSLLVFLFLSQFCFVYVVTRGFAVTLNNSESLFFLVIKIYLDR